MKIAYLDCTSGISGDMLLAALVDAGAPLAEIQAGIDSLGLPSCKLVPSEAERAGFRALKVDVEHEPEHAHRHLHHITDMIDAATMTEAQKSLAKDIFTKLGIAEAKVHGVDLRKVHFHEVGAVDSIADIVGCAIGWSLLGIEQAFASPIPTGGGTITIAHGRVGVPAPATAELLKGVPLASSPVEAELTTPTGAALLAGLVSGFGPLTPMQIESLGFGAGTKDFKEQANVLRLYVGHTSPNQTKHAHSHLENVSADQAVVLETHVDDSTGEQIGHAMETLLEVGAWDVCTTPIQMKKSRPGVKLTVICSPDLRDKCAEILFRETTTFGMRVNITDRFTLQRESTEVSTKFGPARAMICQPPGTSEKQCRPEYESCRVLAAANHLSLDQVYQEVQRSYAAG
jgi:uncharacterized protein (TIGR00299 family) protein